MDDEREHGILATHRETSGRALRYSMIYALLSKRSEDVISIFIPASEWRALSDNGYNIYRIYHVLHIIPTKYRRALSYLVMDANGLLFHWSQNGWWNG